IRIQNFGDAQRGVARAPECGLRQREGAANKIFFREMREALGVGARLRRGGENGVVAGHFALERNFLLDPPDGGMTEEESFYDLLRAIGPVIAAAQMREFMEKNLLEF